MKGEEKKNGGDISIVNNDYDITYFWNKRNKTSERCAFSFFCALLYVALHQFGIEPDVQHNVGFNDTTLSIISTINGIYMYM